MRYLPLGATPAALLLVVGVCIVCPAPSLACTVADPGSISGVVLEQTRSGIRPVPFANVVIASLRLGVMADKDGNFTIPGVSAGRYDIRFMMVGLQPIDVRATVQSGKDARLRAVFGRDSIKLMEAIASEGSRTSRATYCTSSCHPRKDVRLAAAPPLQNSVIRGERSGSPQKLITLEAEGMVASKPSHGEDQAVSLSASHPDTDPTWGVLLLEDHFPAWALRRLEEWRAIS